ncbi:MAG TPA: CapA family protein [Candidatus Hydrogenedentes bacterium]|nr:CapA family protein [Candidatus Hydrogenedentota bacterium]
MITDVTQRHSAKIILAVAAILLLIAYYFVKRGKIKGTGRLVFDILLVALGVASIFAYFEFGWLRYGRYMNPHDVYHYYMGAKYSEEHQYFDLYRCSLVADMEMRRAYKPASIRNLDTHSMESTAKVLRDTQKFKARFSPARWEEFKKDIAYFQSIMPASKWDRVLQDKGYNATPVWNSLARFLTNHCSTSSVWGMRLLTYIDLVFLAVMFGFVWAAFGWRVMAFAIIFHGLNYFMAFVHIKGAFMRLDWVALLIVAVCLIRMGWFKSAGAVAAYAGMARIFPVIFVFGLGAKLVFNFYEVIRDRYKRLQEPAPINRKYIAFFAAFALMCIALIGASALYDGGFQLWGNFFEKIAVHDKDISTTRAGFKYIFIHNAANKAQEFEEHKIQWWSIIGVVLLGAMFVMRKAEDYETIPLSFIAVFFLTAPTFYYYVMLLIPLFLFLPKVEHIPRLFGAIALFLISILAYLINFSLEQNFQFFFILSCFFLAFTAYMAVTVFIPTPAVVLTVLPVSAPAPMTGKKKGKQKRKEQERAAEKILKVEPPVPLMKRPWFAFFAGLVSVFVLGGIALAGVSVLMRPGAPPQPKIAADERQLAFVGDIMLSRNVANTLLEKGRDFTYPFQAAAPYLQSAVIAFGNLECPISGRGDKMKKKYTFNASPEAVEGLKYAGFDVLTLANNHILDFGPEALDDTKKYLTDAGIQFNGICDKDAPQEPVIMDAGGIKIGYLGYCDPNTPYAYAKEYLAFDVRPAKGDRPTLARDIAALKPKVDIVVVSMHWGIEYTQEVDAAQQELGHFIIDQGASIVAGHHPHVQQAPERYKDGLIMYSMGNFVFDQRSKPLTRQSRLYRVTINKTGIVRAEYLPMEIILNEWQPRPTQQTFINIP